jgi:hypothetical protein
MKLLFLADPNSPYTRDLIRELRKYYQPSVLSITIGYYHKINPKNIESYRDCNVRLVHLGSLLLQRESFDICQIFFINPYYFLLMPKIRHISTYLYAMFYGSDVYRVTPFQRKMQKGLVKHAEKIFFTNEQVLKDFNTLYGEDLSEKCEILRFGLRTIEEINSITNEFSIGELRNELDIPLDSYVITCGTNASINQQHPVLLRSIIDHAQELPPNTFLILPLTYAGTQEYIDAILKDLEKCPFESKLIFDYMDSELVAKYCLATDVLVQVQKSDSLSGSMLEHLYAGKVILTGKWLPYKILDDLGVFYVKTDHVENTGRKLSEISRNHEYYKTNSAANKHILWNISSWDANIQPWLDLYSPE